MIRHNVVIPIEGEWEEPLSVIYGKPIGYRPIPLAQYKSDRHCEHRSAATCSHEIGVFRNSVKTEECQITVAAQIIKWMKMRCVDLVCTVDELPLYKAKVNTVLPTVVEVNKPSLV